VIQRMAQVRGSRQTRLVRWGIAVGALIAAAGLGGCGLGIALPTSTQSAGGAKPARSAGTGATGATGTGSSGSASTQTSAGPRVISKEVPTPPGPTESAPTQRSAPAALAHFAGLYINWNAADVKRHLLELANECVGQARTAMSLQAAQTGADPELAQAGIANHGTVEAVAALPGSGSGSSPGSGNDSRSGSGATERYVVVTRESTTATNSSAYQGLAAAWHLTVATVTRRSAGWVISGWQPES
jgi:hypothetical protein